MSLQTLAPASAELLNRSVNEFPTILIDVANHSIVETFEKMFGETLIQTPEDSMPPIEGIAGLISFVGDITWSLAMMFPKAAATDLAQKFAGFEIEYEGADMGDVIGEVANVLAGVICGDLENKGFTSQMSLPTVTRGNGCKLLLGGHLIEKTLIATVGENMVGIKLIISKNNNTNAPIFF